jgi:hypothetical protein
MRFRPGARCLRLCLGFVVTAISAVACAPAPDRARHTVEEYRQNFMFRKQEFDLCTNDPGSLGTTPDCINAREAERLEGVGSLRTLPPLQLPSKKPD